MTAIQYAIVGRIRKAQGIRGDVTIELLTETPERFFARGHRVFAGTVEGDLARDPVDRYNPESRQALVVEDVKPFKNGLIVKFDAIPDRTAAERWRSRYVLVPMDELEPLKDDEVFVHELIGMRVQNENGAAFGEVSCTYDLPQGLTLEVRTERGDVLVPYRDSVILDVDRSARTLTVDADCGLFD
jgi:16S rRNA processing protein RimM